jgi:hypothetical protein
MSGPSPSPTYCPRCGTARVGDMPFCPKCGLNLAEGGERPRVEAAPPALDTVPDRPAVARGLSIPPVVLVVGLVIVGLFVLGLLPRLPIGGPAAPTAQLGTVPSAGGAPIVGLTILSPTDGQSVATKDVLVIGLAPPGVGITQDVSFGLDKHTTVDGTGHWAMTIGLNAGDNNLKFRIGDDHSTEKTIRVIYTPPAN